MTVIHAANRFGPGPMARKGRYDFIARRYLDMQVILRPSGRRVMLSDASLRLAERVMAVVRQAARIAPAADHCWGILVDEDGNGFELFYERAYLECFDVAEPPREIAFTSEFEGWVEVRFEEARTPAEVLAATNNIPPGAA